MGGRGAQRPVWLVNESKKTGARSARARTRDQNPLVRNKSLSITFSLVPYQNRCFRVGSLALTWIRERPMKPFSAVLVTGHSRNRCAKDSFWFDSLFIILQMEHLLSVLARKWAVLLFRGSELFLSLNKNYLRSLGRKLLFHKPIILPRSVKSGICVSVIAAMVSIPYGAGVFPAAMMD
jgi:hypothetical protein